MENIKVDFDTTKGMAALTVPGSETVYMTESDYYRFLKELKEIIGSGWELIHSENRRVRLIEYISEHPGCTYGQIMDDIGDPEKHMGYLSVRDSLRDLLDSNEITYKLGTNGRRTYHIGSD